MKTNKTVLIKILGTMVDEWGFEEVTKGLHKVAVEHGISISGSDIQFKVRSARKHIKATAVQQISKELSQSEVAPEKKKLLTGLAERFDRKEFLPSVSDVREFLIMRGQRPVGMKDRSEAFRILLRFLKELPLSVLNEIVSADSHSGPSRLGPLSEAIAAAGGRLQRQNIFEEFGH